MIVVAALGMYAFWHYLELNRVARLSRQGASYATLIRRLRYRGGRKQRSASRKIQAAMCQVRRQHKLWTNAEYGKRCTAIVPWYTAEEIAASPEELRAYRLGAKRVCHEELAEGVCPRAERHLITGEQP